MTEMTERPGQMVWRELMTNDKDASRRFYGELFGWTFSDMPMPSGIYTIINIPSGGIAGMMEMPPGAQGMPPCWMSYVSVRGIERIVDAIKANGGMIYMGPEDVPEVGKIATIADPTGAVLGLLEPAKGDEPMPEMPPVGSFCWETLGSTDTEKATAFYRTVIGWGQTTMPGGAAVILTAGQAQVADVEPTPPGVASHWMTHVVVTDLAAKRALAERLGATVLQPDVPVPGIGNLCVIKDPSGAVISMFQPKMG